jgi:hypothetical protein
MAEGDLRCRLQEHGPAWVRAVQGLRTDDDGEQEPDAQEAHAAALKRCRREKNAMGSRPPPQWTIDEWKGSDGDEQLITTQ